MLEISHNSLLRRRHRDSRTQNPNRSSSVGRFIGLVLATLCRSARQFYKLRLGPKCCCFQLQHPSQHEGLLSLTLGWASDCGWLEKNPCTRIKLPQRTGGRQVTRTVLTTKEVIAIAAELEE